MKSTVSVTTFFDCSLERAFKTPFLSDVSKVHTGYGLMPRVTHCTEDSGWGQPGSSKKVHTAPSLFHSGEFASVDYVLERVENRYWKIEVRDFQAWMLGFTAFTGEWTTTALKPDRIRVDYTYTLHSSSFVFYPLQVLFARFFWKKYMRQVLDNIRVMIEAREPWLYP